MPLSWRRSVAIGCSLFVLLLSAGCGESSSAHPSRTDDAGQRRSHVETRPISWHLVGPPRGSKIRIGNSVGWCYGAPKPRIEEVRVRESENAVILIALLANSPRKNGTCADLGMGVVKTVELSEDLGDRALYDGSVAPPAKRWPRSSSRLHRGS
jgi:hypothetical protein